MASWRPVESQAHPGKVYFYNEDSRASRWVEPPSDRAEPAKVHAFHVLTKHRESRNPVSRPKGGKTMTATRAEGLEHARSLLNELLAASTADPDTGVVSVPKETFMAIAKRESDCSSASRGGDLGPFGRGAMQPSFEKAAFALDVGEISGVVESDSGFHTVLRVA